MSKAKLNAADAAAAAKLVELIDELGPLQTQTANLRRLQARETELKKQIQAIVNQSTPAEETATLYGKLWMVHVGARGIVRRVTDMAKLYATLGKANFLAVCDVRLGALDECLEAKDHARLIESERSGSRTVASFPRVEGMTQLQRAA
jgi:erythromycin esterase-like protein